MKYNQIDTEHWEGDQTWDQSSPEQASLLRRFLEKIGFWKLLSLLYPVAEADIRREISPLPFREE